MSSLLYQEIWIPRTAEKAGAELVMGMLLPWSPQACLALSLDGPLTVTTSLCLLYLEVDAEAFGLGFQLPN